MNMKGTTVIYKNLSHAMHKSLKCPMTFCEEQRPKNNPELEPGIDGAAGEAESDQELQKWL